MNLQKTLLQLAFSVVPAQAERLDLLRRLTALASAGEEGRAALEGQYRRRIAELDARVKAVAGKVRAGGAGGAVYALGCGLAAAARCQPKGSR